MIDCNPPASQFLSGTADAVRENCPLTDLAPPGADIGRVASESARLMADAREAYATDGRVLGADRSEFFLSISKTLPRDLDSDELCGLVTVARDIAQRLRLEGANLDASERERRSIGGDLHDGLDQELSGLGLLLAVAARRESRIANRDLVALERGVSLLFVPLQQDCAYNPLLAVSHTRSLTGANRRDARGYR